jgi:hypothetical protein
LDEDAQKAVFLTIQPTLDFLPDNLLHFAVSYQRRSPASHPHELACAALKRSRVRAHASARFYNFYPIFF